MILHFKDTNKILLVGANLKGIRLNQQRPIAVTFTRKELVQLAMNTRYLDELITALTDGEPNA